MQLTTLNGYPAVAIAKACKLRDATNQNTANLALAFMLAHEANGGFDPSSMIDGIEYHIGTPHVDCTPPDAMESEKPSVLPINQTQKKPSDLQHTVPSSGIAVAASLSLESWARRFPPPPPPRLDDVVPEGLGWWMEGSRLVVEKGPGEPYRRSVWTEGLSDSDDAEPDDDDEDDVGDRSEAVRFPPPPPPLLDAVPQRELPEERRLVEGPLPKGPLPKGQPPRPPRLSTPAPPPPALPKVSVALPPPVKPKFKAPPAFLTRGFVWPEAPKAIPSTRASTPPKRAEYKYLR